LVRKRLAVGIYIRDPDGNGIEVSYEMPSSEWGMMKKVT